MDRKVQEPFFFFFFGAGLTSLNRQPRRELSPNDCVLLRVTIFRERQKCEHGQKLGKKTDPKKGQVNIQPESNKS